MLVSGNIRYVRIFTGVPGGGGIKHQWGVDDGNFQRFWWLLLWKL